MCLAVIVNRTKDGENVSVLLLYVLVGCIKFPSGFDCFQFPSSALCDSSRSRIDTSEE